MCPISTFFGNLIRFIQKCQKVQDFRMFCFWCKGNPACRVSEYRNPMNTNVSSKLEKKTVVNFDFSVFRIMRIQKERNPEIIENL